MVREPTDLERSLAEAAAAFQPKPDLTRLQTAAEAEQHRVRRRAAVFMSVAGALFGAGVVGLGLPLRTVDGRGVLPALVAPANAPTPDPTTARLRVLATASSTSPSTAVTVPLSAPVTSATTTPSTVAATTTTDSGPVTTTVPPVAPPTVAVTPAPSPPTTRPRLQPATPTTPPPAPTTPPPTTPAPTTTAPPPPSTPPPPQPIQFSATWRSFTCDAPVVNVFFGWATPGTSVTISSSQGSWEAQANDNGEWGRVVVFPGVTGTPVVSVTSDQGTLKPSCGR